MTPTVPTANTTFSTKDSGKREELGNGMVRDTADGKDNWLLLLDGPMLKRWLGVLMRGAVKYQPRNWCLALRDTNEATRARTKERFKESAMRHMMQWVAGDRDEDHAAAVMFNLNGYEAMLETDAK